MRGRVAVHASPLGTADVNSILAAFAVCGGSIGAAADPNQHSVCRNSMKSVRILDRVYRP